MNKLLHMPLLILCAIPLLLGDYSAITDQIQEIINTHNQWHIGCKIYSLTTNQSLYEYNARQLFIPASNTKLFTGALSLELMGPDYRFTTQLRTDGTNIYLKGDGDPSLTAAHIEDMIAELAAQGIVVIENFYLDDSVFDHEVFASGAVLDNIGYPWNSLVTGLMIDRKPVLIEPIQATIFLTQEQNSKLLNLFYDGATLIERLLAQYHIVLRGAVIAKQTDADTRILLEHQSEPLSILLSHMMKTSDNLYADVFFKKVGALKKGGQGTWQKSVDTLTHFLQEHLHLSTHDIVITDGSGRSRYNLIAPEHIVALFTWVYQQPYAAIFIDSLAVSGVDGTLSQRMSDIPGKVRAKTGCLSGVSSLSGCIEREGDIVLFSIMNNAYISESIYNAPCRALVEDALCRLLIA